MTFNSLNGEQAVTILRDAIEIPNKQWKDALKYSPRYFQQFHLILDDMKEWYKKATEGYRNSDDAGKILEEGLKLAGKIQKYSEPMNIVVELGEFDDKETLLEIMGDFDNYRKDRSFKEAYAGYSRKMGRILKKKGYSKTKRENLLTLLRTFKGSNNTFFSDKYFVIAKNMLKYGESQEGVPFSKFVKSGYSRYKARRVLEALKFANILDYWKKGGRIYFKVSDKYREAEQASKIFDLFSGIIRETERRIGKEKIIQYIS